MKKIILLFILGIFICAFSYPEHIATKQDFINLLNMPEYKNRALKDLQTLYESSLDIPKVTKVISGSKETGDLITEEIENPLPYYKSKGFQSSKEILDLINMYK